MDRHFRHAGLMLLTVVLEIYALTHLVELLNYPDSFLFISGLVLIFSSIWLTSKILRKIQKSWTNSNS